MQPYQPQPQYGAPQAPQQYAPAPQQYAPPAPQQYAPAPPAPQQYAGTPAPAAPTYNPAAPVAPINVDLGSPDPTSGGDIPRPTLGGMGIGRLVLFAPTKLERSVPDRDDPVKNAPKDRLTVDFVVLDGPPIPMGGSEQKRRPHTALAEIPYECFGAWFQSTVLVPQLTSKLNPRDTDGHGTLIGNAGLALGRLNQVPTKKNPAWVIDSATPEDEAACRQYLAWAVANNTQFARTYVPAARAAHGAMASVQSAAPAPAPVPQQQPVYAPQPTAPAAAPGQYGAPQYTAPAPAQAAPQPQYAPPPPAAPVAPPAPQGVANPGYDPAAWAGADEATRVAWVQHWAQTHQAPAAGAPASW